MGAHQKIHAIGEKRVAELTGRSLSVVYRWVKALKAGGTIGSAAMRLLVERTADLGAHAIAWGDFEPQREAA